MRFRQLRGIVLSWMVFGIFIALYDHLLLHTNAVIGLREQYTFTEVLIRNLFAGLFGGLVGGTLLVFYVNIKFHEKPYRYSLLFVSLGSILIIATFILIRGLVVVPLRTGFPITHPVSKKALWIFLQDSSHIKAILFWSVVVALTQLFQQVYNKFGHDDFWDLIHGKYNTPKEEERIFLFLDIDSSTTVAEKLGNEKYHLLLKDFFSDMTDPILNNKGNIYQYAGDEVIVSWNYRNGLDHLHCIQCFFDIKKKIADRSEKYINRYGLVPSFKGGIHCGKIVAGEIGIIKRDITFCGDTLNTSARILSKCGELKQELLLSSDVVNKINLNKRFTLSPIGSIQLKGKENGVELFGVSAAERN